MSKVGTARQEMIDLLTERAAARASGILTAERGKHKRLFCMDRGWLVFSRSNVIEEQFGAALVEAELLTRGTLAAAQQQAAAAKTSLALYLKGQGTPSPDALERTLHEMVKGQLLSSLVWDNATFRFDDGRPDLGSEVTTRLSPLDVALEYFGKLPENLDDVRVKIGPPKIRPQAADATELLGAAAADPVIDFLMRTCNGTIELPALVEISEFSEERLLRTLCALLSLKLMVPAATAAEIAEAEAGASREEVEKRLAGAEDADHYTILGVVPTADDNTIREAYYYLARRYHPDRFRSGTMRDLLADIEVYFSKVTEAYNTLHDETLRADYDQQREAARSAPETTPEKDQAYLARQNFARAKVLIDKRRFQDAVQFLENAIQLDGSKSMYHLEFGRVLSRNPRRRQEAIEALETCAGLDPSCADAYYQLGLLHQKSGRDDEAADQFREVLRWEPGHAGANEELRAMGASPKGKRKGLFKG